MNLLPVVGAHFDLLVTTGWDYCFGCLVFLVCFIKRQQSILKIQWLLIVMVLLLFRNVEVVQHLGQAL